MEPLSDSEREILQSLKDAKYGGLRWYPDGYEGFFEVPGGARCGSWQVDSLEAQGYIRPTSREYIITLKGIRALKTP